MGAMSEIVARANKELGMPKIADLGGILIYMNWGDHPDPHVHVRYANIDYVFDINLLKFVQGNPPSWIRKTVTKWAEKHTKELLANWKLAIKNKPLNKIKASVDETLGTYSYRGCHMRKTSKVASFKVITHLVLLVTFEDGVCGLFKMKLKKSGPMLDPILRSYKMFSGVKIKNDVLTWPNGYDVCNDGMYCAIADVGEYTLE